MQIDSVKSDLKNIDKIIKDNVEKAVKAKEKQYSDLTLKLKDQNERII
jgi:hypothetical protein